MNMSALLATAILPAFALGSAAPLARAEVQVMEGVYSYIDEDGDAATWTIRTTCTPHCVAQVTTVPGYGFAAPLINGRHTVTRTVPEGVTCPSYFLGDNGSLWDGGTYPVTVHQWWDPLTLTGGVEFLDSAAPCGIPDPHDTFTLTRIG
jgi:hypothetical protein